MSYRSSLVLIPALSFVLSVSAIADITLNAGDGGNNDGDQEFRFTSVPEYGGSDNLQGNIGAYDPAEHKVAVYIKVAGGWWTKPTFASPLTNINSDGSWTCDITTGDNDINASDIAAFLLPVGMDPLGSSGSTRFPDIPEALDVISVNRLGKQPERTVSFSGLDGNMFEHDWVKSPDGKELLDAITEAGKSKSTRGTTRVENSSAQRPNLPDWLRGRRELYETVVERYDGTELDTRIEEAQRESDAIDRAGDGDTPSSPDFFQPVNDVNPHETPVTSHTLDSS